MGSVDGDLLDPEAYDLLDEVDRARDVAHAPRRHCHLVAGDLEAEPLQPVDLLLDGNLHSGQAPDELRPVAHDGRPRQLPVDVRMPDPARAGDGDEELGCVDRRLLGRVRVDALLPPRGGVAAKTQSS